MNLTFERPLSELYADDITRLRRTELDAIIALHRVNYESNQLLVEAERHSPKELHL